MTWKRVATAAVLIPVVVGLVLWGSTAIVALAIALITLLALFEYFALGEAIGHRAYRFWTGTCALVLIYDQWRAVSEPTYKLVGGLIAHGRNASLAGGAPPLDSVFFLFVLGIATLTLATRRPLVEVLPAAGISASGFILVAFPLSFAIPLHGASAQGPTLLLFAMVIVWVSDTAAYFVGRSIGKHPFAPKLSPKKTWEGAVAGFLASLAAAFVFMPWVNVPLIHLLAMASLGNIAGQAGDLLESGYKRSAGIKDSGTLLPGHGGVLDRIDALILAIPVVWYYWILIYSPRS
ncbi:MAG TPA: phosphatidate cytidylyltransferase [Candidatus Acidoferrum sp.]|nr:phosphatidate cytidylyltransferase [Candidatus Acidoferrum sp.]